MSDTPTAPNQQQTITYALVGVIVVLVAVIAVLFVYRNSAANSGVPVAQAPVAQTPPANMGQPPADVPFDPKTATKVGAGQTPQQHTEAYFKALVKGDFKTAYNLLPADKKAAQDEASFATQLKSYGLTGYKMGKATVTGDETKVDATAVTGAGEFGYTWTFVKKDGVLYAKSRVLSGMGQ